MQAVWLRGCGGWLAYHHPSERVFVRRARRERESESARDTLNAKERVIDSARETVRKRNQIVFFRS